MPFRGFGSHVTIADQDQTVSEREHSKILFCLYGQYYYMKPDKSNTADHCAPAQLFSSAYQAQAP